MTGEHYPDSETSGRSHVFYARGWFSSVSFWTWVAVAIGVLVRITEYGMLRSPYMDENSLLRNLVEMSVFDFQSELVEDQMAAPGYLVLARLLVRLPGNDILVGRLISLVSGIASVFLMRTAARRYLSERAVPLAVALFALVEWMVYYATELKQYSSDVLFTLIALIIAAEPGFSGDGRFNHWTARRYLSVFLLGTLGVWFSQPLIFVLPGVGLSFVLTAARSKNWQRVRIMIAFGLVWVASFGVCYAICQRIISKRQFLWDWWDFAFLRIPPHSLMDLKQDGLQLVNVLISPSGIELPNVMIVSAVVAVGLFFAGCWSLGRRAPTSLLILVLPIVLTVAASALHRYPFHGRLLLFLVPIIHLIVAQGAIALTSGGGLLATVAISLVLLAEPVRDVFWAQFVTHRERGLFDTHGDLTPDLLDYLDLMERRAKHPTLGP